MVHNLIIPCVQGIAPVLMQQGCIELFSFLGSEILLRLHQQENIVETTVAAPSASFSDNVYNHAVDSISSVSNTRTEPAANIVAART